LTTSERFGLGRVEFHLAHRNISALRKSPTKPSVGCRPTDAAPSTEAPMELLLIIVVVLLLFGGGGYWGRRQGHW
jgi:hypothetical protein